MGDEGQGHGGLWEAVALMGEGRFSDAVELLGAPGMPPSRAAEEQRGVALLAMGHFARAAAVLSAAPAPPRTCAAAALCAGDTAHALATLHAILPTATAADAPLLWLRVAHAHASEVCVCVRVSE